MSEFILDALRHQERHNKEHKRMAKAIALRFINEPETRGIPVGFVVGDAEPENVEFQTIVPFIHFSCGACGKIVAKLELTGSAVYAPSELRVRCLECGSQFHISWPNPTS